ncbi:MAG: OB-fold nucleic acid binding domain-containing protein, partial [Gemmatimonadales bacterium]
MSSPTYISELSGQIGARVTVRGWVTTVRSSGKIAFLVLRDGTGYLQCVATKAEVEPDVWDAFSRATQEASATITGVIRADPRSPGGVELGVDGFAELGPSVDFPVTPKEHGTAFLLEHRHLWLRSRRQVAIMRVRDSVVRAIHDFMHERDVILVHTPILTGAIGESAGTLFETEYFDLGKAYLAQTGQLYLEAAAAALS